MKHNSIWNLEKRNFNLNKQTKDISTDILIIGGGLTGISTAFYLKDSNLKITLIEANEIGSGTTMNTTGKINFMQGLIYHKIKKKYNLETSLKYLKSQIEAMNLIESNIKKYNIDCDYMKNNSYVYTDDDTKIKDFIKEQEFYNKANIKYKTINKLPLNIDCKYGIQIDNTAIFHPIKYLYKLTEEILKSNIEIYEHTTALKITKDKNYYLIDTNNGIISTKYLIIATHYPFFIKPGYIPFKTHIEKEYILATKVDKINQFNSITNKNPIISIRYHQDKDNYLLFASINSKLSKNQNNKNNYKKLIRKFEKTFDNQITNLWFNYDLITNDQLPFIGELKENFYLATGFNKWGMTNATISGKIISDLILNNKNEYVTLFDPKRSLKIKNFLIDIYTNTTSFIDSIINKRKDFYQNIYFKKINNIECAIYIDENKKEHIVKNRCPHMGCKLTFNNEEKTWDCPCHGSRYDLDGNIIKGPSNKNIKIKKETN